MALLVVLVAFLALSDDRVLNPDVAVRQLEAVTSRLQELSAAERQELVRYIDELRGSEVHDAGTDGGGRLEFLRNLPRDLGLV